jgi:hypothetical protein
MRHDRCFKPSISEGVLFFSWSSASCIILDLLVLAKVLAMDNEQQTVVSFGLSSASHLLGLDGSIVVSSKTVLERLDSSSTKGSGWIAEAKAIDRCREVNLENRIQNSQEIVVSKVRNPSLSQIIRSVASPWSRLDGGLGLKLECL